MENFIKLVDILVWPITLVVIAFLLRKSISKVIERASKVSVDIGGQKLSIERQVEKEAVEKIEKALDETPNTSQEERQNLKLNVRKALISVLDGNIDEQDVAILMSIKVQKEVSRRDLENIMTEYGMRAGLGGALTGLQHDGYISGHFEKQNIVLTDKGEEYLSSLNLPNKVLQFVPAYGLHRTR